jgi:hypothetical protein
VIGAIGVRLRRAVGCSERRVGDRGIDGIDGIEGIAGMDGIDGIAGMGSSGAIGAIDAMGTLGRWPVGSEEMGGTTRAASDANQARTASGGR